MDFLSIYNLFMALAVAGACGVCDGSDNGPGYNNADSAYMSDGGASTLPPAYAILNHPLTQVDNGYNPAFYWNQPHDEDSDDDADNGYPSYSYSDYPAYRGDAGYSAAYPTYDATAADLAYAEAANGGYGGGYDAEGSDEYGYGSYQRPVYYSENRVRHAHRTVERHDRDHAHEMPAADRHDIDRGAGDEHAHAGDNRGAGYNGHDRGMFDGDHRPAKPAPASYQVHDGKDDSRHRPHQ